MTMKFFYDGYRLKPKPSYQIFFRCLAIFVDGYRGFLFVYFLSFLMCHPHQAALAEFDGCIAEFDEGRAQSR